MATRTPPRARDDARPRETPARDAKTPGPTLPLARAGGGDCRASAGEPVPGGAGGKDARKPHPSLRRRYTPALLADGRRRYEQTAEPLADIAADFNLHRSSLRRMAGLLGWVRYVPPPRDLPADTRLRRQAEALAARVAGGAQADPASAEALPSPTPDPSPPLAAPTGDGETAVAGASPQAIARSIDQMLRVVQGQIDGLTALRAQMDGVPLTHSEIRAASRAIVNLTATLRDLHRMRRAPATSPVSRSGVDHDDDMPRDIDEFRRELARRIDAFVASRTEPDHAGGGREDSAPLVDEV